MTYDLIKDDMMLHNLIIEQQLNLFFEITKPIKRFKQHMLRKSIATQRSVFKGQTAARIAAKRNVALDSRKKFYRQMYLKMKAREQQMYGNAAKSQAMRH